MLVDYVATNLPVMVHLQSTEEQLMKESNILADIVAKYLLVRIILQNTVAPVLSAWHSAVVVSDCEARILVRVV